MSALPQDEELSALLNDLDDLDDVVEIAQKPIKQPKKAETKSEEEKEPISLPEHTPDPEPQEPDDKTDLYDTSVNELLSNYRKDRKDVDKLITYLWDKLEKSDPSRVIFETLAISLRTKSETNSNLLKLIDLIGKKNKSSSMGDFDLEDLLDD